METKRKRFNKDDYKGIAVLLFAVYSIFALIMFIPFGITYFLHPFAWALVVIGPAWFLFAAVGTARDISNEIERIQR
jgi:hypothetical protein